MRRFNEVNKYVLNDAENLTSEYEASVLPPHPTLGQLFDNLIN